MTKNAGDTSVFTDDSGSRRRWVAWTFRSTSVLLILGVLAVVISMVGNVSLPGFKSPLSFPGTGSGTSRVTESRPHSPSVSAGLPSSGAVAPTDLAPGDAQPSDTVTRTGRTTRDSIAGNGGRSDATPVRPSTPAPGTSTPAVPSKPGKGKGTVHGKPTSKPTNAAEPVHSPGSPPTEPPGKAKKSSDGS
ncbi:hypothetical protein [Aeromicrobium sp. P5_D10]